MKFLRLSRWLLLVLGGLAIFGRLFLIWNVDRNGGITCIWLRDRPALEWREFSTAAPEGSHARSVVCGDENGVSGEDWLVWNNRFGWWLLPTAALAVVLLERVNSARSRA